VTVATRRKPRSCPISQKNDSARDVLVEKEVRTVISVSISVDSVEKMQALERLQRFWEQRSGNTPLINKRYEMSGYV